MMIFWITEVHPNSLVKITIGGVYAAYCFFTKINNLNKIQEDVSDSSVQIR